MKPNRQELLRHLPAVDRMWDMWQQSHPGAETPKPVVINAIREALGRLRSAIINAQETVGQSMLSEESVLALTEEVVGQSIAFKLKRVINGTGVVIHTNLGRSCLSPEIASHVAEIAARYSNLEFDLARGVRGSRYSAVEGILCEITGAEAAIVVNNNAGAVFLALETLAKHKEVIVSRGQLVEIGGSFRIPDVMNRSGAKLVEVGTTNRTHLRDYENAIRDETALLLKVHTSNYSIVGFTAEVALKDLVALGAKYHLPVMEDLGSGSFIDFAKYGLVREPTVQDTVAAGVDVVTFSGDKLLGGPQAGIIVGKKDAVESIKRNPINRALRIDKLTLAALEATLHLYRDESLAVLKIPTLRMLTLPEKVIAGKARRLRNRLAKLASPAGARITVNVKAGVSRVGGGSLPLQELPTRCVGIAVEGLSANGLEALVRRGDPPIVGRIEDDCFVIDVRTVQDEEIPVIAAAIAKSISEQPR